MPLWTIPVCLLLNIFLFWLILKRLVLKTIVFMYALKFIPNREMRIINAQYCNQLSDILRVVQDVVSSHMLQADYKACNHETVHIIGTEALERLIEMLERFTTSNQALIDDHERKVRLGRKTSRQVPD